MMRRIAACVLLAFSFAALAADPEVARLLERAKFWRDRSRDDLAREEIAKVFRLAPDQPQALGLLARIQLTAGQERDAAATLERLRASNPRDPEVGRVAALMRLRGPDGERYRLAQQLARAGRHDEAVRAYRALFPGEFPDDDIALEYARSLAATAAGRDEGAARIAGLARRHPDDPDYQVALAVDQSARRPVAAATFRALRDLAAVPSVARQAIDAWRRALLALDPVEESAAPLREYLAGNPGDTALQEKLAQVTKTVAAARRIRDDPGYRARREGVQALESGRLDEAQALLERAMAAHADDAEAVGGMGLARLRQGRHAEALELFLRAQRLDPSEPNRARWTSLQRTARYWSLVQQATAARAAGSFDAARALAGEAVALDGAEPAAKAELARIEAAARDSRADALRDRAKELVARKQDGEALAALEEAAALAPANPWIAHDLARLYSSRGEAARGDALFRRLIERQPTDPDARYAMALFLASTDRDAEALVAVQAIPAAQRSDGMNALAERLQLSVRTRQARRQAEELSDASRAAQRKGDIDGAVDYEQRALALEPSDEPWRMRRLAELRDQQLGWMGGALDALHRSGSAGKSRLDAEELAFGYRQAWKPWGRAFIRIAPSRISSGTLDLADAFEVSTYGSNASCQPACAAQAPPSTRSGVALSAGAQVGGMRFDVGSTPIGFPVVNVVGGALHEGSAGGISYSVEASRRPVVSSLLSYAGALDPASGITWGGVVATGVRVNVSRDAGGDYGAWALAGGYRLTGRHVKDNDKAELMAGGYRRFVNEENLQLAAGLTAMLWRFSEGAGEFTLGHGGYYSPRRYQSLSLPVTYAMRSGNTSYYARASVSVSRSTTWRAPFFPADAALQAQAEARADSGGIDPFYTGGDNARAFGRSFAAAAEHRLAPNIFVGARVDIERSTNYTPNRLLLYVRMSLGGAPGRPLAMPPEPVVLPGFQF